MTVAADPTTPHVTRFDRLVWAVVATIALAVAVLGLIGDRVGVRVVEVWPEAGSEPVSTLIRPRVVFDQPVSPPVRAATVPLRLVPETAAELVWSARAVTLRPLQPLQPAVTYTVHVDAGIVSTQGRRLLRPLSWQFTTDMPRVVYLRADRNGQAQLFAAELQGILQGVEQQLTEQPGGVWDFHVAGDGSAIAYSSPRDQHGNDLFAVARDGSAGRLLLDCGSDDCFGPRWAPGGGRIAFARRTLPGPPRVYLLDPSSGAARPVLDDASFVGFEPRWAPNGEWLAWVAPLENGVRLVRLSDGASAFVPSRTGEPPVWNRTSSKLMVTDVDMDDTDFRTRLVILDIATLSLDATDSGFEEWALRWAPDGQRVSVLRRAPGARGGGQVWLVGQQAPARQLTDAPSFDHGAAQWSADGRYLAFHRISLEDAGAPAEIVLWDTETGTEAAAPFTGRLPNWLP